MTTIRPSAPEPNYRVITWSVIIIAVSVVFAFLPRPGRIDVVAARNIIARGLSNSAAAYYGESGGGFYPGAPRCVYHDGA